MEHLRELHAVQDWRVYSEFVEIVMSNSIELVLQIWEEFPNADWTYGASHVVDELYRRGLFDMLHLFAKHKKLSNAAKITYNHYFGN